MTIRQSSRTQVPPALRWTAAFCALTVWLLGLFATSAQLHGSLHRDIADAGHACAITLFREGVEDSVGATVLAVTPVLFSAGETVAAPMVPVADADVRLPPGCGPPLC